MNPFGVNFVLLTFQKNKFSGVLQLAAGAALDGTRPMNYVWPPDVAAAKLKTLERFARTLRKVTMAWDISHMNIVIATRGMMPIMQVLKQVSKPKS